MKIPFLDLKSQYDQISEEINDAVNNVIKRQSFVLGEALDRFETGFAKFLGVRYVCGVNSGTDGLILSLKALGIGRGDEVITTALSFIATTLAITEVGATPVFVDIDPNTYQIDVNEIENKINKKTKAMVPVHLYGAPCEIEKIVKIANKYGLKVIEDACQAHGTSYHNKKAGTFGDIGVFSFYPGKNLGAYGDGGAICTNDSSIYERIMMIRNYGQTIKYHHETLGTNSRLDEVQAAVLSVKLRYLNQWNSTRRKIANKYNRGLMGCKTQAINAESESCYHIFVMETEFRDELACYLDGKGIQTLIHYPIPIHLQNCYKYLGYKESSFPNAEKVTKKILSLPIYSELKVPNIEYIIDSINGFNGSR